MERTTPQSIGDILRIAFQDNCMQDRLDECKAAELWGAVVGEEIASKSRRPLVKNGIMTIGIPNPALRNELAMNRTSLRNAINSTIGRETITEIRFIS